MSLTTLEQSKNLKEWGAPQDTSHYWFDVLSDDGKEKGHYILREADWKYDAGEFGGDKAIAAYDLESLIEWLGNDFCCLWAPMGEGGCWKADGKDRENVFAKSWVSPLEAVYALAEYMHLTTKV